MILEVKQVSLITTFNTIEVLEMYFLVLVFQRLLCQIMPLNLFPKYEQILKLNGIKHSSSCPYVPRCNEAIENSIKIVKIYLIKEVFKFNQPDIGR